MQAYCIRDLTSGFSLSPVVAENDLTFMRMVRSECANANPGSNIIKYPEEFALVHVGEWDPETGVLTGYPHPRTLGKVSDLLPPPSVDNTSSGVSVTSSS